LWGYFKTGTALDPSSSSAASQKAQQAASSEASATRPSRPPHVVAVTGGKGGVGKSTIAVNLAIALARAGHRACILDGDTGLANINILLGLKPRFSLEHVIFGAKPIEETMLDGPFGLRIVPGANGISACANLLPRQQMRLTRELARIEAEFEYLIVDSAAGIADSTLDLVGSAHQALLVITPDPTSLTDAFSLVKLLQRRRAMAYQVVVNQCDSEAQAQETYRRFSAAVRTYIGADPKLLDVILRSDSLQKAVTRQTPVALLPEDDPACRNFIRLAEKLRRGLGEEPPALGFADFWHQQYQRRQAQPAPERGQADQEPRENPLAETVPTAEELQRQYEILLSDSHASPVALAQIIQKLHEAFQARFDRLALEPLALVEWALEHEERYEQSLRKLADALHTHYAVATTPRTNEVPQTRPQATPAAREGEGHRFDESRFGSQRALLGLLRAPEERPVSTRELIASLAPGELG
jgi:flagellar biosynthesis protein FlhG